MSLRAALARRLLAADDWATIIGPAPALPVALTQECDAVRDHRYRTETATGPMVVAFLRETVNSLSPRTQSDYEYDLAKGCVKFPHLGIRDWEADHIYALLEARPTDSRRRVLAAWARFFQWALMARHVDVKPTDRVEAVKKKGHRVRPEFTPIQVDSCIYLPPRDGGLMALIHECGIRKTEAATMQGHRVDFERESIRVLGKRDKEREVPLTRRALARVAELFLVEGIGPNDYLYYGVHKAPGAPDKILRQAPPSDSGMHRWWVGALAAAGVPYWPRFTSGPKDVGFGHLHQARRTYARRFLDGHLGLDAMAIDALGGPGVRGAIELLRDAMGHEDIGTTDDYARQDFRAVQAAVRAMEAVRA